MDRTMFLLHERYKCACKTPDALGFHLKGIKGNKSVKYNPCIQAFLITHEDLCFCGDSFYFIEH